jgi:hypothetical protein
VSPDRVLLVSSSGGVLLDLLALRPWWAAKERLWLVVDAPDTSDALAGEAVVFAPEVRPSSPAALLRGTARALRLLRRERIGCVVTAGSGIAVPVFAAAAVLRVPSFWLETRNVLDASGLAARLGGRLATSMLVQHPSLLAAHSRAALLDELY